MSELPAYTPVNESTSDATGKKAYRFYAKGTVITADGLRIRVFPGCLVILNDDIGWTFEEVTRE